MLFEAGQQKILAGQRVAARGRISVRLLDGRSRLQNLYQDGAAKIRMPRNGQHWLQVVLINTAGGLTGGDRIAWNVEIGPGASVVATTQACEKVYRALSGRAELTARVDVGAGGRIAWLPQETILFDRAAFARSLDIDLAKDAEALVVEATVFGRRAMGERMRGGEFRDRWRVRQDGRLVHAEDFAIGPEIASSLERAAVTGGAVAMATVLYIASQPETMLDRVRAIVGEAGGASVWRIGTSGKLLARLFAEDSYTLRKRLAPLIELLNGQAGLPKVWSI